MGRVEGVPRAGVGRGVRGWTEAKKAPPGVGFLASEMEALEDAELAFRLGALLLDRPGRSSSSPAGWSRRLGALLPHLQAHLARRSSTPRKHLGSLDARGDDLLAARIAEAEKAAGA